GAERSLPPRRGRASRRLRPHRGARHLSRARRGRGPRNRSPCRRNLPPLGARHRLAVRPPHGEALLGSAPHPSALPLRAARGGALLRALRLAPRRSPLCDRGRRAPRPPPALRPVRAIPLSVTAQAAPAPLLQHEQADPARTGVAVRYWRPT